MLVSGRVRLLWETFMNPQLPLLEMLWLCTFSEVVRGEIHFPRLVKKNNSPLKSHLPKRKVVFQPSSLRNYVKHLVCLVITIILSLSQNTYLVIVTPYKCTIIVMIITITIIILALSSSFYCVSDVSGNLATAIPTILGIHPTKN